jgi:hypothetical protein
MLDFAEILIEGLAKAGGQFIYIFLIVKIMTIPLLVNSSDRIFTSLLQLIYSCNSISLKHSAKHSFRLFQGWHRRFGFSAMTTAFQAANRTFIHDPCSFLSYLDNHPNIIHLSKHGGYCIIGNYRRVGYTFQPIQRAVRNASTSSFLSCPCIA